MERDYRNFIERIEESLQRLGAEDELERVPMEYEAHQDDLSVDSQERVPLPEEEIQESLDSQERVPLGERETFAELDTQERVPLEDTAEIYSLSDGFDRAENILTPDEERQLVPTPAPEQTADVEPVNVNIPQPPRP